MEQSPNQEPNQVPNQEPNNDVQTYMDKLKKGDLPPNPEQKNEELKAGRYSVGELAKASRMKLMGDKRTIEEIVDELRSNEQKAA
jgi:hypothetical protein